MARTIISGKGHFFLRAFCFVLVTNISGCMPAPPPPPPPEVVVNPPQEEVLGDVSHLIKFNGETLGVIAKWYTGDPANWLKIRDANPGVVPERLRIGTQLNIPESLVVKRDPLPEEFLRKESAVAKRAIQASLTTLSETPADAGANKQESEAKIEPVTGAPVAVGQEKQLPSLRIDKFSSFADALAGALAGGSEKLENGKTPNPTDSSPQPQITKGTEQPVWNKTKDVTGGAMGNGAVNPSEKEKLDEGKAIVKFDPDSLGKDFLSEGSEGSKKAVPVTNNTVESKGAQGEAEASKQKTATEVSNQLPIDEEDERAKLLRELLDEK